MRSVPGVPRVPGTVPGTPKGVMCPVCPARCPARHRCAARATLRERAARLGGNRHKWGGRGRPARHNPPLCPFPRERHRAATACAEGRERER